MSADKPSEPKTAKLGSFAHPRYWTTWLFWGWMQFWARAPFGLALRVHEALGRLLYAVPTRGRKIVQRNLQLCFPELSEAEVDALAKRHFAALVASFAETAVAWCGSDRHMEGRYDITGLEHVSAALALGKGAILFTGHFTGLEICGRPLKPLIPRLGFMYSRRSNALMNEIQRRGRERCAHESIPSDRVRALLDALKRNFAVWYAPDQATQSGGAILVPFFAEPMMMTAATSRLARISEAPLLPFSYYRVPGEARYQLEFHAPLENFPSDDEAADTHRLAQWLETFVRDAPEQYLWIQKKFRGRPGMPDAY